MDDPTSVWEARATSVTRTARIDPAGKVSPETLYVHSSSPAATPTSLMPLSPSTSMPTAICMSSIPSAIGSAAAIPPLSGSIHRVGMPSRFAMKKSACCARITSEPMAYVLANVSPAHWLARVRVLPAIAVMATRWPLVPSVISTESPTLSCEASVTASEVVPAPYVPRAEVTAAPLA